MYNNFFFLKYFFSALNFDITDKIKFNKENENWFKRNNWKMRQSYPLKISFFIYIQNKDIINDWSSNHKCDDFIPVVFFYLWIMYDTITHVNVMNCWNICWICIELFFSNACRRWKTNKRLQLWRCKFNFPALLWSYDRPTNRPTDRPTKRRAWWY